MIKVILWDIDGTLLDFGAAERYAVRKCFDSFGFGECTDEMLARYSAINKRYWEMLERGEVTKEQVFHGRYEEFLRGEHLPTGRIGELNREYQVYLSEKIFFQDYGYEIIWDLKGKVRQYVVTNGSRFTQTRKMRLAGYDKLFDGVFISDEVGAEKPNIAFFDSVWEQIGTYEKAEVMIVGDSLTSDMQGGNNAGIRCCWYNPQHAVNDKGLRIDYEIQDLRQVKEICQIK